MNSTSEVVEQVEITLRKRRVNCSKAMRMSDILPEEVMNVLAVQAKEGMNKVGIYAGKETMNE